MGFGGEFLRCSRERFRGSAAFRWAQTKAVATKANRNPGFIGKVFYDDGTSLNNRPKDLWAIGFERGGNASNE